VKVNLRFPLTDSPSEKSRSRQAEPAFASFLIYKRKAGYTILNHDRILPTGVPFRTPLLNG
jgi:hypothetical protein